MAVGVPVMEYDFYRHFIKRAKNAQYRLIVFFERIEICGITFLGVLPWWL